MVEIKYNTDGRNFILTAEGHCGQGTKGNDLACAGVSTLIIALDRTLEKHRGKLELMSYSIVNDGTAMFDVTAKKRYKKEINAIFDTVLEGLKWISEEYPKSIKIIFYDAGLSFSDESVVQ